MNEGRKILRYSEIRGDINETIEEKEDYEK